MRSLVMKHYVLFIVSVALALLIGACGQSYSFRGGAIDSPKPAPDFTLLDQNNQPFSLSEQRDSVVLLFFGFTNCPDVCPTTLADLAAARQRLGAEANKVRIVMVSVDPKRDTPAQLKSYLAKFDTNAVGLTGDDAMLAPVYKAYGVTRQEQSGDHSNMDGMVQHSSYTYVIDRRGDWRALFDFGTPVEDIVSDLEYLIRER